MPVYDLVVKHNPFSLKGFQHKIVARPEGLLRKRRGAESVLIAHQNKLIAQTAEVFQRSYGPGYKMEEVQTVQLVIVPGGRLPDYGPVPVYK